MHLQASIFKQKNQANIKTFYSGCSDFYYEMSVELTVILSAVDKTSECYLSKETRTMHVLQLSIYFGMPWMGVLDSFYRVGKGLNSVY